MLPTEVSFCGKGLTMDKLEKVRVKMQNNRVKCALELNKNVKHEEEKKAFCNSITRSGESQTTVCIPMPRKCTEVDLYIDKNLSIQVSKTATFFSCCSIIICLLISLLLFLVVRYQNSELQMMEQNIMVLKRQVEILAGKSYSLGQNIDIWALKRHVRILAGESYILSQNIDILQDGVNSLMHKQFTTVNVIAHDQDIQHSHGPEDVSNPEMETEQGSNFVSLELDSSSNTDAGLEDTVKSGNVIDVKNRSLYTSDEHSDSLSTNAPLFAFGTPDIMNSIFPANNVASLTSQELKLQNINDSSVPPDGEVLLSAVGSLSSEDVATDEGVRAGRAKRADRRGNQKPSGGRRHLNSQRKNRGPSVVHLKGAVPDVYIEDGGLIAPWYVDEHGAGDFLLSKFQMREGNGAIQVSEQGLYYIYAQVYYLTAESSNSFSIRLREEGKSSSEELAVCSVNTTGNGETSEVSCFTSVVRFLNATDRVFVWQRERNRKVILRDGYTFLGVVHLNGKRG